MSPVDALRGPVRRFTSHPKLLATLLVAALLVAAFLIGSRHPVATVQEASCDTTGELIRCYPDGRGEPWVAVHRDGLWQDANHVWRRGVPDCLDVGGRSVGPVQLATVRGSDDGMAWVQVVWVGCG